jgi:hypothetical protein
MIGRALVEQDKLSRSFEEDFTLNCDRMLRVNPRIATATKSRKHQRELLTRAESSLFFMSGSAEE